jgi:hypothetical protein
VNLYYFGKKKKEKKVEKKRILAHKMYLFKKDIHHFHEIEMYQRVCSKVDAHTAFFLPGEMKNKKLKIQVFLEVFDHDQK